MRQRSESRLWVVAALLVLNTRANPVIADISSLTPSCHLDTSSTGAGQDYQLDSCEQPQTGANDDVWSARQSVLGIRGSGVIGHINAPAGSGIKHAIVQTSENGDLDTGVKTPLNIPVPPQAEAASAAPAPPSMSQTIGQTDDAAAQLTGASEDGADKSDALKPKISYGGQHSSVGITGGSKKSSPGLAKTVAGGAGSGVLDSVLPAELHGVASNQTSTVWSQSPAHQPSPSASPVPESDTMNEGVEPDADPTGPHDATDPPSNSNSSSVDSARPSPRFEQHPSPPGNEARTGPHRLDQERPLLSAACGWKKRASQMFGRDKDGPDGQSLALRDAIVDLEFPSNSSSPSIGYPQ
ncbi:hypothetical protein OC846_001937 [Tilletia horrida]|uniref:Uncharacterized protein n=1 Tax=Tilletia horrida TaxID=155126 RepID=A0AAN6GXZ5_9BASI|nr:hypothetical protein OC846_001937 [Tilletia horrida]